MARSRIESERVRVTPALAQEWLDLNRDNNRKVSEQVVARYAKDMLAKEWAVTGDSIKFDWNGRLIDGQHRLLACVKSGKSFDTVVVRGVDPAAFTKMDQNRVRTAGQVLGMEGIPYSTTVAATSIAVEQIQRCIDTGVFPQQMGWHSAVKVSPDEVLHFVQHNEHLLLEAVTTVKGRDARRLCKPPSAFAATYFILANHNRERTREFFHLLGTGLGLEADSPIYQLRNVLQDAVLDTRAKRTAPWKTAVTIKAWNMWLEDRSVSQLRFRTTNERFPMPRKRAAASNAGD